MTGRARMRLVRQLHWFDVGLVCGVAASVAYAFGVFIPIPPRPEYLSFMAFGPLFAISAAGMFVFLSQHRDTVSLRIGTFCMMAAGLMFTAMATMQGSIIFQIRDFIAQSDPADVEVWRSVFRGTMATQLGLDFAFDMYISAGTFLVAWNVVSHPRFWRGFGWAGMAIAAAGLTVNAITFPENSGEAGLFDPAPLYGVWFGGFIVPYARARSWYRRHISTDLAAEPTVGVAVADQAD